MYGMSMVPAMPSMPYLQYTFTATPEGGGPAVVVTSTDPDVRFYGLAPDTEVGQGP